MLRMRGYAIDKGPIKGGSDRSHNSEISSSELEREFNEKSNESEVIKRLSEKFIEDKEKIESAIDRVSDSTIISDYDKRQMLSELENAFEALQEQYDREVYEEQERIMQELEDNSTDADLAIGELTEQEEYFEDTKLDVASTDMSDAALEAESKKREFEDIRDSYNELLQALIDDADAGRSAMMDRRRNGSR